jgi:hypothetical protein
MAFRLSPTKNKKWNTKAVEDVPDKAATFTIYLIGKHAVWSILFCCPCGCKRVVHLNTLPDERPSWSYELVNNSISIWPSIRRIDGCRSHFFVENSRMLFVRKIPNLRFRKKS